MKLKVIIDASGGDPQHWGLWNGHQSHIPEVAAGAKRFLVHVIIPDEAVVDAEYLGSEKAMEARTSKNGRTVVL